MSICFSTMENRTEPKFRAREDVEDCLDHYPKRTERWGSTDRAREDVEDCLDHYPERTER